MQGLCDGYFVLPYTIGDYLGGTEIKPVETTDDSFERPPTTSSSASASWARATTAAHKGTKTRHTVLELYRELGLTMWDHVGMERSEEGLKEALEKIPELKPEVLGDGHRPRRRLDLQQDAGAGHARADFFEIGELMARDALDRDESAGGHFRPSTRPRRARRCATTRTTRTSPPGSGRAPMSAPTSKPHTLHKEELTFENVKLTQRSKTTSEHWLVTKIPLRGLARRGEVRAASCSRREDPGDRGLKTPDATRSPHPVTGQHT